jgi:hypothetical protein
MFFVISSIGLTTETGSQSYDFLIYNYIQFQRCSRLERFYKKKKEREREERERGKCEERYNFPKCSELWNYE